MNTILKWLGNKVCVMAELSAQLNAGNRLVEPFPGYVMLRVELLARGRS